MLARPSVTTRLLPWEVNNAGLHMSFPGGDDMFQIYNAALQLSQVHYGEVRPRLAHGSRVALWLTRALLHAQDMKAAENQDFISQGSTNNAT